MGHFLLPGMNQLIPSTNPKQPVPQESFENKKVKKRSSPETASKK
jgi:hypothetical protein